MYERCTLTVLPSVVEGFGLVVVESWLHRKPPVVSSRAGVAELIEEGKNGLLFNPDDSAELARKMRQLLDDHELAVSIGRHGYVTSKRCSIDEGLRAETEVITELVG
jgi:glycosyltransferase involved in cell wall biosynthesis